MTIIKGNDERSFPIEGTQAFALAVRMSREQWILAGNELPSYSRAEMPIVFIPSRNG